MLTAERLRELLDYDPETGAFKWLKTTSNRVKVGAVAGTPHKIGYRLIAIDGTTYYGHRLAWLYMHGEWPASEIDHRNRIKGDDRIANLREASHAQNMKNLAARSDSTTGIRGIRFRKDRGKWVARISNDGQVFSLGNHECFGRAVRAYRDAARELHGEFSGRA